jgi:N-carbamoyl-L-amino-acid hydrolase
MAMSLDPKRTVAELKELRTLTGDENGAQRVAFTQTWAKARAWLRSKVEEIPAEVHTDEAGNLWATVIGESEKALLIGGHFDSVPNGGWLDGCLNTLAGVEILRRIHAHSWQAASHCSVGRLGDEEGARFGKAFSVRPPAPAISTWMKRARCATNRE